MRRLRTSTVPPAPEQAPSPPLGDPGMSRLNGLVRTFWPISKTNPTSVVRCLDIAEAEIAAMSKKHPVHAALFNASFRFLCPSPVLLGKDPRVFAYHCRELLIRRVKREDTRPGTKSEVLCHMLEAATVAPLNRAGFNLCESLFAEVMPERLSKEPIMEEWPGQLNEDLEEARRKTAVPERR